MTSLTKDVLLAEIALNGYGYYPYSSEDTFELLHSETTRYSVVRVPVEFVKSFEAFAAQSFVAAFGAPKEKDLSYVEVSPANEATIEQHLKWLDTSDEPASLKYKEVALRGLHKFETAARIQSRDQCTELIAAKTKDFYVRFLWFTTG